MQNNDILITICARGGSKGLPGKHLRMFYGRPLIQWTIDQALEFGLESGAVDIIVSSDSSEILKQAEPATEIFMVHKRSEKLASDSTPKLDVIRDAVMAAEGKTKKGYSIIVDLDVTNPLRTMKDIEECIKLLKRREANTVVSVVKSRRSPYFNMMEVVNGKSHLCKVPLKKFRMEIDGRGGWTTTTSEYIYKRQDVPYTYDLNSSIYVYNRDWLLTEINKLVTIADRIELYVMPDCTFCDIDTEMDFELAEHLARKYFDF